MARTVNVMRERRGLAPLAEAFVRPHVSRGARGMILAAFDVGGDDPAFTAMRDEFLEIYAANLCVGTRLFPGMDVLLDRLDRSGIAWGVVTNKFERFARPVVEALVGKRAAIIVGGDTCARAKPHPDSLLHAARVVGVAPERALYVGDDERDVQAARAAGMHVVVAGYGYLGDGAPPAQWNSEAVLDSPAALDAWIRNARARNTAGVAQ
jgi:phosphoglycolate phosphatase